MSDSTPFDAPNAGYVQALWEEYSKNPEALPEEWRNYFSGGPATPAADGLIAPDGLAGNGNRGTVAESPATAVHPAPPTAPDTGTRPAPTPRSLEIGSDLSRTVAESPELRRLLAMVARATSLVQAFRDHGHRLSAIDPLGSPPPGHPQLDPEFFGLSMDDLEQIPTSVVLRRETDESLAETLVRMREAYCGSIGYEFEHMADPEKVEWLWEQVESGQHVAPISDPLKVALLERLTHVEGMERFLHRAYLGQKRFSIEGTDALVPMLDVAVEEAARQGAAEVIIGMAHRGRLNVLAHVLGADYAEFLRSFENMPHGETSLTIPDEGTGDVKYHHGARGIYQLPEGGSILVSLAPNPSHLEFVNPLVAGYARVRQFEEGDMDVTPDHRVVLPVVIHGDAAFAAEGVVAETLNMSRLEGYDVGGTLHIIANNQIGFTTDPAEARSTQYASDLAKGFDIPIIHVNADDPQACLAVIRLAMQYRARFNDDVVIDLMGYRRHGHNEGDEPGYTQPELYAKIAEHPTAREIWARTLVEDGILEQESADGMVEGLQSMLRDIQDRLKEIKAGGEEPAAAPAQTPPSVEPDTSVPFDELEQVNRAALAVPEGFEVHPKLHRQLSRRGEDFSLESSLDWGHGETLAYGTLLKEGIPIRMSGQDAERGTFSHRHMVLHDHRTGEEHNPLASMGGARFEIYNSPLTETAVLGFEYGYSVGAQHDLVIWEAQFGDFVNVAQVILDQFLSSGRTKWGQLSSLTLLLPHGYEGQGPEHSSARLERFLQLCAEDNMRVAYPTTPAQFFHLMRRQALARPLRPLVVMSPKSLLRHPRATSTAGELVEGAFQPVLQDASAAERADRITRLILCSGKAYFDVLSILESESLEHVAVARLEQLYPFPDEAVRDAVAAYPNLTEVVWTQEEPRNMEALSHIGPRLRAVVPRPISLKHSSRPERASPAEGNPADHRREQDRLVREALGLLEH
jgi:2-oxoglutarate dehydrogenase E1 component